MMDR